jgi:hypothetical protein
MLSTEESCVGAQLDKHHAPETNGRMSVCRRCGSLTDTPAGSHHVPQGHQVARSIDWLNAEARTQLIDQVRNART